MTKKILAFFVAFCMVCSLTAFPVFAGTGDFTDMPSESSWAYTALKAAVENGLLKGSNGILRPFATLSRAEMAAVINNAFGASDKADISGFTDVPAGEWYAGEIAKAVRMGSFAGSGTTMRPEDPVTREEAFVVVAKILKLEDAAADALNGFGDKADVSTWAVGKMAALVKAGYVSGSNGNLNPKKTITRAEFAQVMYNIIGSYISKAGTYTEVAEGNLMVNAPGVTLKDATVKGDLIVGEGVGNGEFTLDGTTVTGRLIVRGGGEHSIIIKNKSTVGSILVGKTGDGGVRVRTEEGCRVEVVTIDDGKDDIILEGEFNQVAVATDTPVVLKDADVTGLTVKAENASVKLDGETKVVAVQIAETAASTVVEVAKTAAVTQMTSAAESVKVSGEGKVEVAVISGNNTSIDTTGTKLTVDENTTGVTENGKTVDSGKEVVTEEETTTGGSSGGGGSVHTHSYYLSSVDTVTKKLTYTCSSCNGTKVEDLPHTDLQTELNEAALVTGGGVVITTPVLIVTGELTIPEGVTLTVTDLALFTSSAAVTNNGTLNLDVEDYYGYIAEIGEEDQYRITVDGKQTYREASMLEGSVLTNNGTLYNKGAFGIYEGWLYNKGTFVNDDTTGVLGNVINTGTITNNYDMMFRTSPVDDYADLSYIYADSNADGLFHAYLQNATGAAIHNYGFMGAGVAQRHLDEITGKWTGAKKTAVENFGDFFNEASGDVYAMVEENAAVYIGDEYIQNFRDVHTYAEMKDAYSKYQRMHIVGDENGEITIEGDFKITKEALITSGTTITIPAGKKLTIANGDQWIGPESTIHVNGTLQIDDSLVFGYGSHINVGTNGYLCVNGYLGMLEGTLVNNGIVWYGENSYSRMLGVDITNHNEFVINKGIELGNSEEDVRENYPSLVAETENFDPTFTNYGKFVVGTLTNVGGGTNGSNANYYQANGTFVNEGSGNVTCNGNLTLEYVDYSQGTGAKFENYNWAGAEFLCGSITVPEGGQFKNEGYMKIIDIYSTEYNGCDLSGFPDFFETWNQDGNDSNWCDFTAQAADEAGIEKAIAAQKNRADNMKYNRLDIVDDITLTKNLKLEAFNNVWLQGSYIYDEEEERDSYDGVVLTVPSGKTLTLGVNMTLYVDGQNTEDWAVPDQLVVAGTLAAEMPEVGSDDWSANVEIWSNGSLIGTGGTFNMPADSIEIRTMECLADGSSPYDENPVYLGAFSRPAECVLTDLPSCVYWAAEVRSENGIVNAAANAAPVYKRLLVREDRVISIEGTVTIPAIVAYGVFIEAASGLIVEEGAFLTTCCDVYNNGDVSVYGTMDIAEGTEFRSEQLLEVGAASGEVAGTILVHGYLKNFGYLHIYKTGVVDLDGTGEIDYDPNNSYNFQCDEDGHLYGDTTNRTFEESLTITRANASGETESRDGEVNYNGCTFCAPVYIVYDPQRAYRVNFEECTFLDDAIVYVVAEEDAFLGNNKCVDVFSDSDIEMIASAPVCVSGAESVEITLNGVVFAGSMASGNQNWSNISLRYCCTADHPNSFEWGDNEDHSDCDAAVEPQIFVETGRNGDAVVSGVNAPYTFVVKGNVDISGLSIADGGNHRIRLETTNDDPSNINIGSNTCRIWGDQNGHFEITADAGAKVEIHDSWTCWNAEGDCYESGPNVTVNGQRLDAHIFCGDSIYISTADENASYQVKWCGNSLEFDTDIITADNKTHLQRKEDKDWFEEDAGDVELTATIGGVDVIFEPVAVKDEWGEYVDGNTGIVTDSAITITRNDAFHGHDVRYTDCTFGGDVTIYYDPNCEYRVYFENCGFTSDAAIYVVAEEDAFLGNNKCVNIFSTGDIEVHAEAPVRVSAQNDAEIILNDVTFLGSESTNDIDWSNISLRCCCTAEHDDDFNWDENEDHSACGADLEEQIFVETGKEGHAAVVGTDLPYTFVVKGVVDISRLSVDSAYEIRLEANGGRDTNANIGANTCIVDGEQENSLNVTATSGGSVTVRNTNMYWDEDDDCYIYGPGITLNGQYLEAHIFGGNSIFISTDDEDADYQVWYGPNELTAFETDIISAEHKTHLSQDGENPWFTTDDDNVWIKLQVTIDGASVIFDPVAEKPEEDEYNDLHSDLIFNDTVTITGEDSFRGQYVRYWDCAFNDDVTIACGGINVDLNGCAFATTSAITVEGSDYETRPLYVCYTTNSSIYHEYDLSTHIFNGKFIFVSTDDEAVTYRVWEGETELTTFTKEIINEGDQHKTHLKKDGENDWFEDYSEDVTLEIQLPDGPTVTFRTVPLKTGE